MLPDYPRLKRKIWRRLNERLRQQVGSAPSFSSRIKEARQFEGTRVTIVRPDGKLDRLRPGGFRTQGSIKLEDLEKMTLDDLIPFVAQQAQVMVQGKEKMLAQALERYGPEMTQLHTAAPFDPAGLMRVVEAMEVDFNGEGQPLTIICHPSNFAAVQAAAEAMQSDPALAQQWNQLMERKREEWRAREAARILAG